MLTSDFEYSLPQELIAQNPVEPRDQSRLMRINRSDGLIEHHTFDHLPAFLRKGDVLVFNDTRVIPARLAGQRDSSKGKAEILLLRRLEPGLWEALARPGRRLKPGTRLLIHPTLTAEIVACKDQGIKVVRLSDESLLSTLGTVPLPPYIRAPLNNPDRYQTVYARINGSVAAPTAGLHFTPGLLQTLAGQGVEMLFVTLHIGLDTFRPIAEEEAENHNIHKEYGEITEEAAQKLNQAIAERRRIIAVGTTTVRLLENAASRGLPFRSFDGEVDLFILPGFRFRIVDAMLTNFHLPRSTLLMLVSAFTGRELIRRAYQEAISRRYRFYSFGDCMIIL